jgi:1-acyl-sn-glycerol-3-phosphate acyltransferase
MTIKQLLVIPWRMTLTAYCFLQFALQLLWLGKWQMPRLIRVADDPRDGRHRALYAAHRHVIHYLNTLDFLGLVKFRFDGDLHRQPCLMVGNHPSLLDFIVLLRDLPNAICLYKAESLDNPVLSSFVQVAGYIEGLDGTPGASRRIVSACCERYAEGHPA